MTKKRIFIFLSLLIIYALYCAMQLGQTYDILFHYELGKDRLNYLLSLGANEISWSNFIQRYYSGAYNTISAFLAQFFPREFIYPYSLYAINLTFGFFAVFGISKIAKELFNREIGQITFLFCFFNPIFFGHIAMNSLDTIIAFANVWFFYTVLRYLKNQKKNNYVLLAALLLGIGQGTRVGFLITLTPILFLLILEIFYFKILIGKNFSKKIFFKDSVKILIFAYFFMVLFWPETHQNIFLAPIKLVIESLSFGFGYPFTLFNGEIILTSELPNNYLLTHLFYKMPEFIVFSFILFICFFYKINFYFKKKIKQFNKKIYGIIIIILFPHLLMLISPWSVWDGVRLFLYIIPYICIVPAILAFFLYKKNEHNLYKFAFIFLIILKIFFLYNFFTLTPYHYVYLNLFAGKYSENSKKFENDYWGVSTNKLVSQISNNNEMYSGSEIKIATCGVPLSTQNYYLKKIKNLKYKLVEKNENFDFIIMNNRVNWDHINRSSTVADPKKAKTCFEQFLGEDIIKVQRRGLVLSKITKI